MSSNTTKAFWQVIAVGSAVLIVDQVSKKLASDQGVVLLNTGVSFGLLSLEHPFLSFAIILGFGLCVLALLRHEWQKYPVSTGLFVGGAVSNLTDRVLHGGVRDWLGIGPLSLKNNLADWAIFVAVLVVLFTLAKEEFDAKMLRKSSHRVQ